MQVAGGSQSRCVATSAQCRTARVFRPSAAPLTWPPRWKRAELKPVAMFFEKEVLQTALFLSCKPQTIFKFNQKQTVALS